MEFKGPARLVTCGMYLLILLLSSEGVYGYGTTPYFGFMGYRPAVAWDLFRGNNDYIDQTEFDKMLKALFGDFYDSRPEYRIFLLNLADLNRDVQLNDDEFKKFYGTAIEFYAASIEDEDGKRMVAELDHFSKNPCASLTKTKIDFSEYYSIRQYKKPMGSDLTQSIFTKLPEDIPRDWPIC